ncbi:MJ1255/VC2487 family glycosyltransferase [Thaumasiovibrio sp. DFM-14]|uniref:MJ1255/VC2487 family glycosyltransferase n=1 Tax=Thaumasiovibrio sp. DFM-14 TaxID=3384792 RepID=UPI0039A1D90A
MKILYGVQGTGNGHISRAREMARAFAQHNVEVDFLFSGRNPQHYFDMEVFETPVYCRGLTFLTENGQINHAKSLLHNRLDLFWREVRGLNIAAYDLVLNDFEPVTAWAAKRAGIPSIAISHQCSFLHPIPKQGQGVLDKLILRHFAPTKIQLGLHWYHFEQTLFPPIIPSLPQEKVQNGSEVLVYLPFESVGAVVALLNRFPAIQFNVFHPTVTRQQQQKNVHLHPLSKSCFQNKLLQCHGVIANGGFELPSEAIGLGKKLLLKPLKGQFEQESNVMTLEMMGLAQVMTTMNPNAIRTWLDKPEPGAAVYPNVAEYIAQWVVQGDWWSVDALFQQLWSQVQYPEAVADLVGEFEGKRGRSCQRWSPI